MNVRSKTGTTIRIITLGTLASLTALAISTTLENMDSFANSNKDIMPMIPYQEIPYNHASKQDCEYPVITCYNSQSYQKKVSYADNKTD